MLATPTQAGCAQATCQFRVSFVHVGLLFVGIVGYLFLIANIANKLELGFCTVPKLELVGIVGYANAS